MENVLGDLGEKHDMFRQWFRAPQQHAAQVEDGQEDQGSTDRIRVVLGHSGRIQVTGSS